MAFVKVFRSTLKLAALIVLASIFCPQTNALPFLASHANQRWPSRGARLPYLFRALPSSYSELHRVHSLTFPLINPAEVEQRIRLASNRAFKDAYNSPSNARVPTPSLFSRKSYDQRHQEIPVWFPFARRGDDTTNGDYVITLTPEGPRSDEDVQVDESQQPRVFDMGNEQLKKRMVKRVLMSSYEPASYCNIDNQNALEERKRSFPQFKVARFDKEDKISGSGDAVEDWMKRAKYSLLDDDSSEQLVQQEKIAEEDKPKSRRRSLSGIYQ